VFKSNKELVRHCRHVKISRCMCSWASYQARSAPFANPFAMSVSFIFFFLKKSSVKPRLNYLFDETVEQNQAHWLMEGLGPGTLDRTQKQQEPVVSIKRGLQGNFPHCTGAQSIFTGSCGHVAPGGPSPGRANTCPFGPSKVRLILPVMCTFPCKEKANRRECVHACRDVLMVNLVA
jgi:hypothetical protein